MTRSYARCEIVSFGELEDEEKKNLDCEQLDGSFVVFKGEALWLGNFIRTQHSKIWDGIYSDSAFSGYFIKISKSGDCALVAYRHF